MPIRFRCAYCNQLMGIARRKAGTVVNCPNCSGQVVVPGEEENAEEARTVSPAAQPGAAMFERSDFDQLLHSAAGKPAVPAATSGRAVAPPPSPALPSAPRNVSASGYDVEPVQVPAPHAAGSGIQLSPGIATLLSIAVVISLALSFTGGLLVGRFYLQPPSPEDLLETTQKADEPPFAPAPAAAPAAPAPAGPAAAPKAAPQPRPKGSTFPRSRTEP